MSPIIWQQFICVYLWHCIGDIYRINIEHTGPAITAPATPGPAKNVTANLVPAITPMALASNGPSRQVAHTQFPVALHQGMDAPEHGTATNALVAIIFSMAEQISQVAKVLTYIRQAQQISDSAPTPD